MYRISFSFAFFFAVVTLSAASSAALVPTVELPGAQPDILQEEQARLVNVSSVNATWTCHAIHKACAGIGTDEQALIDILGPMPAPERHVLADRYTELYDTDLDKLLISETSGPFADLLVMLLQKSVAIEHDVVCKIRDVIKHDLDIFGWHISFGTEGDQTHALIPLFVGRSVDDLAILVDEYQREEKRDLVNDVKAILSPYMTKALVPSLEHSIEPFNTSIHTLQRVEADAEKLFQAGKGRLGTDEATFIPIIMASPPQHLVNVSRIYQQKYSHSVLDAAKAEFKDDIKHALVFRIELVTESFADAAATMLNVAMDRGGTDESLLSATIVRYFDDLPEIDAAYRRKFHQDLRDRIDSETSGYYNVLLLRVFDAAIPHAPSERSRWPLYAMTGVFVVMMSVVLLVLARARRWCQCRCRCRCGRDRHPGSIEKGKTIDEMSGETDHAESPNAASYHECAQ